jgi:hypothetical protein
MLQTNFATIFCASAGLSGDADRKIMPTDPA